MSLRLVYNDHEEFLFKHPQDYQSLLTVIKDLYGDDIFGDFKLQYEDSDGDLITLSSQQDYQDFLENDFKENQTSTILITSIGKSNIKSLNDTDMNIKLVQSNSMVEKENQMVSEDKKQEQKANNNNEENMDNIINRLASRMENMHISSGKLAEQPEFREGVKDIVFSSLPEIAMLVNDFMKESGIQQPKPGNANTTVHPGVECDKCGVNPIVGDRYKCLICPNFDYCSKCEALNEHPHAFIKFRNPQQAKPLDDLTRSQQQQQQNSNPLANFLNNLPNGGAQNLIQNFVEQANAQQQQQQQNNSEMEAQIQNLVWGMKDVFAETDAEVLKKFVQSNPGLSLEELIEKYLGQQ